MLLKQMKYFAAVVETNSFTEAAERCFISQSAISQQIQALEEDLGVQLIVRERRRFKITPAGEYFYRRAVLILDDIKRMRRETIRISGSDAKRLRIGYLNRYDGNGLQRAVAEYTEKYPDSEITVISGTHEELYNFLNTGKIDMAVSDQRRTFSDEYVNFFLTELKIYSALSSKSALCHLEYLTVDDLKNVPCIIIVSENYAEDERQYCRDYLGIKGSFIAASDADDARFMVSGNRGFLPVFADKSEYYEKSVIKKIPFYKNENQMLCSLYAFWRKANAGAHLEEFAGMLYKQYHCDEIT